MKHRHSLRLYELSKPRDLSHSSHIFPSRHYLHSPHLDSLLQLYALLTLWLQTCTVLEVTQFRAEQDKPFHCPVADLGLLHPRAWLVLLAVRVQCWLKFNLLSDRTLRSFSMGLLSCLSSPSYVCPGLVHLRYRIWHSLLLNFIVVGDFPAFYFVKISFQGLSTLKGFNSFSQFTELTSCYCFAEILKQLNCSAMVLNSCTKQELCNSHSVLVMNKLRTWKINNMKKMLTNLCIHLITQYKPRSCWISVFKMIYGLWDNIILDSNSHSFFWSGIAENLMNY